MVVIGNIVRRIMAAVREETEAAYGEELKKIDGGKNYYISAATTTTGRLSLESMLWALPQHVRNKSSSTIGGGGGGTRTNFSSSSTTTTSTGTVGGKVLHHLPDADRATYERQESVLTTISNPGTTTGVGATDDTEQEHNAPIELFPVHYYTNRPDLKQVVLEGIQEIITDLEDLHKNINEQATNHIHTGEVILTIGQSKTIELFLKSAAKSKRIFQVIVVIGSTSTNNQYSYEMAKSLAEVGIETTVINESAVFAIMARVHKVLLPARAVLANGGLVASVAGSNLVAVAAQHHSVPVQCITGLFKLCPRFPHEGQDTLNDLLNTGQLLCTTNGTTTTTSADVEFINPAYDYIEPKHIGLYITNVGSFQPSFIYRMLAENYHTDDWDSFE
jgi:translation initiation factor eIF-2B subunit beta